MIFFASAEALIKKAKRPGGVAGAVTNDRVPRAPPGRFASKALSGGGRACLYSIMSSIEPGAGFCSALAGPP